MESSVQRMREAFEEILEKIDAWRTDGTMEHWQYSQLFDIVNSALILPLRNCDVGTAELQGQILHRLRNKQVPKPILWDSLDVDALRGRRQVT